MNKPLTLLFDPFESIVLFLSGEVFSPLPLRRYRPLTALLRSFDRQLRCSRWQVKLARGHDPHVCVYPISATPVLLVTHKCVM